MTQGPSQGYEISEIWYFTGVCSREYPKTGALHENPRIMLCKLHKIISVREVQ